ncbi:phenolic acid decarboxylase [Streptomyces sp. AV19]|uniref:phenolic acid decarboxylase n=1 Tax=Streptomyces sp. AV19 TaxID=2793068 RepID=UPI0018FE8478|nr:phenolic acid decarboxylase [Streptomyces sp. AV19]MBH1938138.1 phenolic acid decarboxylase [Streptomyces sp. AV19]MDG4534777.1 phenolic acid decarboxylase [Streptomyces sp. AV19]
MTRFPRKPAARLGAAALLSVTVLGLSPAVAQAADCLPGRAATRQAPPRFADRTLEISYDNGFRFELDFDGARTAHWKVLAGQDPAEGTVEVAHRELAPGVYRLKWTEADGTTVEQVQDWRNRTVRAVIQFEQDGKKQRLDLKGTFMTGC